MPRLAIYAFHELNRLKMQRMMNAKMQVDGYFLHGQIFERILIAQRADSTPAQYQEIEEQLRSHGNSHFSEHELNETVQACLTFNRVKEAVSHYYDDVNRKTRKDIVDIDFLKSNSSIQERVETLQWFILALIDIWVESHLRDAGVLSLSPEVRGEKISEIIAQLDVLISGDINIFSSQCSVIVYDDIHRFLKSNANRSLYSLNPVSIRSIQDIALPETNHMSGAASAPLSVASPAATPSAAASSAQPPRSLSPVSPFGLAERPTLKITYVPVTSVTDIWSEQKKFAGSLAANLEVSANISLNSSYTKAFMDHKKNLVNNGFRSPGGVRLNTSPSFGISSPSLDSCGRSTPAHLEYPSAVAISPSMATRRLTNHGIVRSPSGSRASSPLVAASARLGSSGGSSFASPDSSPPTEQFGRSHHASSSPVQCASGSSSLSASGLGLNNLAPILLPAVDLTEFTAHSAPRGVFAMSPQSQVSPIQGTPQSSPHDRHGRLSRASMGLPPRAPSSLSSVSPAGGAILLNCQPGLIRSVSIPTHSATAMDSHVASMAMLPSAVPLHISSLHQRGYSVSLDQILVQQESLDFHPIDEAIGRSEIEQHHAEHDDELSSLHHTAAAGRSSGSRGNSDDYAQPHRQSSVHDIDMHYALLSENKLLAEAKARSVHVDAQSKVVEFEQFVQPLDAAAASGHSMPEEHVIRVVHPSISLGHTIHDLNNNNEEKSGPIYQVIPAASVAILGHVPLMMAGSLDLSQHDKPAPLAGSILSMPSNELSGDDEIYTLRFHDESPTVSVNESSDDDEIHMPHYHGSGCNSPVSPPMSIHYSLVDAQSAMRSITPDGREIATDHGPMRRFNDASPSLTLTPLRRPAARRVGSPQSPGSKPASSPSFESPAHTSVGQGYQLTPHHTPMRLPNSVERSPQTSSSRDSSPGSAAGSLRLSSTSDSSASPQSLRIHAEQSERRPFARLSLLSLFQSVPLSHGAPRHSPLALDQTLTSLNNAQVRLTLVASEHLVVEMSKQSRSASPSR